MPELLLLLAGVAMAVARVCRPQQTSQVSVSRHARFRQVVALSPVVGQQCQTGTCETG